VFSQFCEDLWRGLPGFRRDALADLPAGYCVAHGINFSDDFVAGDAWISDAGKEPFDGENI
jgi:hypothetical protein